MAPEDLNLLAEAAAAGDDVALRELVLATQDSVRSLCRRLGSVAEAEDLAQETYLRALRALPSYRFEAPVRVWLLSIARHVCADHVRRKARRRAIARRYRSAPEATWADHRVAVDDLVQRLDGDQAEAFVLTQELGLSYAEAAEVCDCPVGTIRSRVSRARAELASMVRAADAS
jgi:RNA polymerase sigma-70 factor (ECF subfamily)